jgi:antitoxin component YwqK of YwqJK toxin-antitoxin module
MGKPIGQHILHHPKKEGEEAVLAHVFSYDENGKFHGEQKSYFLDGKTQTEMSYDHGELHGSKKIWDEKGNLIETALYAHGKLDGLFFQRAPDGREVTIHYKDNFKSGPHAISYPPNAQGEKVKAVTAHFENDRLQGIVSEYNELGSKVAETPYRDGKKEGQARLYSPDGKLNLTIQFIEDKKEGLQIQHFSNGAVFRETAFADDLRNGEEKTYYENGALASLFLYKNDQLEGLCQSWNKDGILVFEAEYLNGGRHGKFNKFYDNGKPYIEQTFAYDAPIGQKRKYDLDGKVTVSNAAFKETGAIR